MADEFVTTLRAWLDDAARVDPRHRRFGVAGHRYRLAPPLTPTRVEAIEAAIGHTLPASYRRFVTELGDGGAGPFHGVCALDRPVQLAAARGAFAPEDGAVHRGVIAIGHLGCGQLALLVLGGPRAGEVWCDARTCGGTVRVLAVDFDHYYLAWVQAHARNELLAAAATPGACPLPRALSQYLARWEDEHQVARGGLDATALRAALAALPRRAIRCEASGDDPFVPMGLALAPCPNCAIMIERLEAQGLPPGTLVAAESSPLDAVFEDLAGDVTA